MRRLICAFVVRICHKTRFRMTWPMCGSHAFREKDETTWLDRTYVTDWAANYHTPFENHQLIIIQKYQQFTILQGIAFRWKHLQENAKNIEFRGAENTFEPRHNKTCLWEFPIRPDTNRPAQPQKLASLQISAIESRDIILSMQQTTKALIRLRGCASWYAP